MSYWQAGTGMSGFAVGGNPTGHGGSQPRPLKTFASDSEQYLHYLGTMLHSEPIIERCINAVSAGTLAKGISCMSRDRSRLTTAAFQEFVDRHYVRFARDCIRMFYVLGFVVWRIVPKKIDGKRQLIPEVLPLGTFTWNVRVRESAAQGSHEQPEDESGVLFYDVRLNNVDTEFHVFDFVKPDLTMQCTSALSSVIPTYLRLQITRASKMRCEEWNAAVRVAIENSEKMQANQMADDGAAINTTNPHFDSFYEDTLAETTEARAAVAREQATRANFPSNTHMIVLPKNHTVRQLDAVDPPSGTPECEVQFQREVCYAFGIPVNLVMQLLQVSSNATTSGATNDATTNSAQMLRHTCTLVGEAVCDLLSIVYRKAYAGSGKSLAQNTDNTTAEVVFEINCTPALPIADIIELHFRKFVEDEAVNAMLLSSIGFPLNRSAERLPWNRTVQKPSPPEQDSAATDEHRAGAAGAKRKRPTDLRV